MDRFAAMGAFVSVASLGSFTRAAEALSLSPQLVSKYVGQLESHLGVRLLNRTTRQVRLTEAGRQYLPQAQRLLEELEDLEGQVGDLQGEPRGLLRISAPVSFAGRQLGPMMAEFRARFPQVSVDLQLNDRQVDILNEGFDIALRIGELADSSLIAKRLANIRIVVCASPDYLTRQGEPQTLEDLASHRYLRYSYVRNRRSALFEALEHSEAGESDLVSNSLTNNNGDVLAQAAIAGAGIAVQPTFICAEALADGRLKRILVDHEPEPLGLYAIYAHRQLLASKVRSFLNFADGYFGDPPAWDRLAGL